MLKSIINEHQLHETYTRLGINDSKIGRNMSDIKDYIDSDSKSLIKRFLSDIRSRLVIVQNSLKFLNANLKKNNQNLELLDNEKTQNPSLGIFKITFMFIIPAILYVVGDIMFSKELIVQGWGLGNSNPLETWSLALAIGVAPFFVKYIFEKFINPYLNSESIQLRRFLTGFYIFLGIIMIASFLQIGYLRGVLYKITKLSIEGNIYDTLYALHPSLMVWSFVVVALMFVIGGGILLSIGSNQLSIWFLTKRIHKQIKKLEKDNYHLNDEIKNLLAEETFIKNMDCTNENIELEADCLSKTLYHYYTTGFITYKQEQNVINNDLMEKIGVSEYLRVALDKIVKNGKVTNGEYYEN